MKRYLLGISFHDSSKISESYTQLNQALKVAKSCIDSSVSFGWIKDMKTDNLIILKSN